MSCPHGNPIGGCDTCNEVDAAFEAGKRSALAEQPAQQDSVAWKHDCAALLQNDVELWVDRCPHCGKPRTTPQAQPAQQETWTENPAAPVQEWRLVPVLATREIEDAIGKARNLTASKIWKDALAAAPQPAQSSKPFDTHAAPSRSFDTHSRTPQQETVAWAETAMRLAADLSIESLRLGSYERKDKYENAGRASWQTIEIREKREAARECLRQHVYTSPQAQRTWVGLTDEEILAANYPDGEENGPTISAPDFELYCFAKQVEAKLKERNT